MNYLHVKLHIWFKSLTPASFKHKLCSVTRKGETTHYCSCGYFGSGKYLKLIRSGE